MLFEGWGAVIPTVIPRAIVAYGGSWPCQLHYWWQPRLARSWSGLQWVDKMVLRRKGSVAALAATLQWLHGCCMNGTLASYSGTSLPGPEWQDCGRIVAVSLSACGCLAAERVCCV